LLDGQLSHDQVTRLLASDPKNSADLWKIVKHLVRAVENDDATISIDDSISEKPHTDENDIIAGIGAIALDVTSKAWNS
jgi:hypothetical protein